MTREIVGQSDVEALAQQWAVPVESTDSAGPPTIRSIAEITSFRTYAAQNIDWIVDGIIAAGTVTLMSGESGSGKSTVTSAICSAVERGVPFAGLATQRRPVLILDRENPLPIVVDRFNRLGIDDSPNFKYWGGWLPEEAPSTVYQSALLAIASGDLSRAEQEAQKAVELAPGWYKPHALLSQILETIGKREEALVERRLATDLGSPPP